MNQITESAIKTFEVVKVDGEFIINGLIRQPLQAVFVILAFIFAMTFLMNLKSNKLSPFGLISKFWLPMLRITKICIYTFVAALVFFYDFNGTSQNAYDNFIWEWPGEMLLANAVVGILATYEIVTGIADLIISVWDYHRKELDNIDLGSKIRGEIRDYMLLHNK